MTPQKIRAHMEAIQVKMESRDLEFYVSRQHNEVLKLISEVGKPYIHPMSRVKKRELVDGRAFWLFLRKDGRCIACISVRSISLDGVDFGTFFKKLAAEQYAEKANVVRSVSQPVVDLLSGELVYLGGIEFAPDQRGSIKVLGNFTQYARLMAASLWEFDWMYTIIAHRHRRLADDYGFETSIRNAVSWADPIPEGLANDQMILTTSKVHFSHVLHSVDPGQL